jgi:hypothetical protein
LFIRSLYLLKVAREPQVHQAILRYLSGASVKLAAGMMAFSDLRGVGGVAVEGLIDGIGTGRYGRARKASKGHGEGGDEGKKQARAAARKALDVAQRSLLSMWRHSLPIQVSAGLIGAPAGAFRGKRGRPSG